MASFHLENCSYKDIATILELLSGLSKSRIARGILQFRKILLPDGTPSEPRDGEWD